MNDILAEGGIRREARHEVVDDRGNGVISTKAFVQRLGLGLPPGEDAATTTSMRTATDRAICRMSVTLQKFHP
jgi:hypothetical protein